MLLFFDNVSSLCWFLGIFIFFLIFGLAFLGYILPMTQMSFWGLTVFSNLLAAVPLFGFKLCLWLWGCEFIQDVTLIKLHSLHIFLPFILMFFIFFHFFVLHFILSSDGFFDRYCFVMERLLFLSWYFLRDVLFFFLFFLSAQYFFFINWFFVFHEESFLKADNLKTPEKVIPEWFFLFYFGFIKCFPAKLGGIFFVLIFFLNMFFFVFFVLLFFIYVLFCFFFFFFFIFLFLYFCFSLFIIFLTFLSFLFRLFAFL